MVAILDAAVGEVVNPRNLFFFVFATGSVFLWIFFAAVAVLVLAF